jgi:hypothetical protein
MMMRRLNCRTYHRHNNYYYHDHHHYDHHQNINGDDVLTMRMMITIAIMLIMAMLPSFSPHFFHQNITNIILISLKTNILTYSHHHHLIFLTLSLAFTSAQFSNRVSTVSSSPSLLANMRAVHPHYNNNEEMRHENKIKIQC